MFLKCWNSITKPGHAGKYERTVFTLKVTEEQWQSGVLSDAEKRQLQKIKANLREASALAKESGLMEG
jgi:ABC-type histidine transport system ATPase subunit